MRPRHLAVASVLGLAALGASSSRAHAACDAATSTCSTGSAALRGQLTSRIGTAIDSGWQGKGRVKTRTQFTIDPVAGDPLVKIDLPASGALVEATWSEAGFVVLRPVASQEQTGSVAVHYTLTPDLTASIFGFDVHYDANQLLNKMKGASFNYDARGAVGIAPWGFAGGEVRPVAPPMSQSTLFSMPFSDLGVPANVAGGTLSIQAVAEPIFTYRTREVRLDSGAIASPDGSTRVPVTDADGLDVQTAVTGDVFLAGTLKVQPTAQATSVAGVGVPSGLLKLDFDLATVDIGGSTTPVAFETATIRIPLPNVKVPDRALGFGDVAGGSKTEKTITIKNTGELGAQLTFESSDPQFVVSKDTVKITAKGSYELPISFQAISGAPASATITVRSNDPDSPVQTFKVGGNGADIGLEDLDSSASEGGCSASPRPSSGLGGLVLLGIGAAIGLVRRRRG